MRKCFMSLLSCVMAISLMSMSIAFASEEKPSISDEGWYGDFRYVKSTYDDWLSCIEIVEYKPSEETDSIEIPAAIGKWSVVIIGESAFEGVAAERIVVPDSVKEIKKGAFANS